MRAWLFGLSILLAGCGAPPPGQCSEQEQCEEGQNCNPPDYRGFCSSGTSEPECNARGEACTTGQGAAAICWYVDGVCGVEHQCRVACTVGDDSSCVNENEICRADGQCTAASCNDGEFTCGADASCATEGGDVNGCLHPSCTDDAGCGDGQHCVMGRCFLEFGDCQSALL